MQLGRRNLLFKAPFPLALLFHVVPCAWTSLPFCSPYTGACGGLRPWAAFGLLDTTKMVQAALRVKLAMLEKFDGGKRSVFPVAGHIFVSIGGNNC